MLAGCGNKSADVNDNTQTTEKTETEVVEIVENATTTESEDGSIIVETDTGEQVVIDDSTKVTENEDGSKTYETEDGTKVNVNADGHSYSASVTKEATCTSDGTKVKNCTVCGTNMENATITKLGHKEGNWEVTKNANCKTEGTKVKKCTTCGTQLKSETIAKTGHTPGDWVVTKEATGITEYKYGNVWGYFDDTEAESLLYWINEQRKATKTTVSDNHGNVIDVVNVSPLNKNNTLMTKAKNRAAEVATNFNHGEEEHECLSWGNSTGYDVYAAWYYSPSHHDAMINSDYTIGGVAFFWYDSDGSGKNLTPIAVLELGY